MDKRTLTALQESIEKWRQIYRGEMADTGDNCSLCMEFYHLYCVGCPVKRRTGYAECRGTPYEKWRINAGEPYDGGVLRVADTPSKRSTALAEMWFLQSLLPGAKREQR